MKPVSLIATASYLPENVVDNAFFSAAGAGGGMFKGARLRRHVAPGETSAEMIARAAEKLRDRLGIRPERDIDLILTNTTCPDVPFTGCGASVARRLGARPEVVLDVHNAGCVSFVYMMSVARSLMTATAARTALICNAQTAAGRVFSHVENRARPQSAVPGDGCGVGYLVAGEESPVSALVTRCCAEFADEMVVVSDDGRAWWEPRRTPMYIDFDERRVATIIARGNALVPEVVQEACRAAGLASRDIDVLVTNQPSPIFLRNWREALQVPASAHVDTFEEHGNLFGAAIPISIERALEDGKLRPGRNLVLGGFSHAGDYAAAAVIRWGQRGAERGVRAA